MSNIFDGIQEAAFDVVTTTMGYTGTWLTSSPVQTAPVLLKRPTSKDVKLNGVEYTPFNYFIEYREGFFPGLVDLVRANSNEKIEVLGITYYARTVDAAFDGKTVRLLCELLS